MNAVDEKPVPVVEINDESMSELEDGELEDDSDDEPIKDRRITYGNSSSTKDILSKRAERFGVSSVRRLPEDPDIRKLHISMGVNSKTRTEALHLYGTDSMKTQDIFQYFDDPPASVEWLTNQSCNAVWLNENACAKALLKHSIKIRGQGDAIDSDSEEDSIHAHELRCALPPGGIWRKGQTRSFAPNLLIRYATVADKKELRPFIPESLKMKEKLFPDGGDESIKKLNIPEDESNPWSGLARQWGSFERNSRNKFGVQDARELIKEKELRESLIKKDARDLIKYNRICRLGKGLELESLDEWRKSKRRSPLKRLYHSSSDESSSRKRRRHSPLREENLQIIVENDSYKPKRPIRARSVSSSSESSSSSSGDSSSSSSDDSSSSSSSSDDEAASPPVKAPSLRTPWNKTSNKFKPESSLLIEIDNDHYRKKRMND